MCKGIGVDLCAVSRMEEALTHAHFMERVFTPEELTYIRGKGKSAAQTAAGLFAAKEAYLKALGTGIDRDLRSIVIAHTPAGQPYYGNDEKAMLPVSHENGMAAAFCMINE